MRTGRTLLDAASSSLRRLEEGAIGWLAIGILVGIGLVVFGIIKFLIPGE
jgi:hypothetical protein